MVTVVDPTFAVVPGARLVLTDLRRGTVAQAETNEVGYASLDFLTPSEYSLTPPRPVLRNTESTD